MSTVTEDISAVSHSVEVQPALRAALLTGGVDRPYAYGLAMSLAARNVDMDVIGNAVIDSPEMHATPNLHFIHLWPGEAGKTGRFAKWVRILNHYVALLQYACSAQPRLFHILWNSKVQIFDRTLLMLYYKALGKKVTLTAHNVNQARRDGKDTTLNRLTLRIQYNLTDHIFVHTEKMKAELTADFNVSGQRITVIRHPVNDAFPDTELTPAEARSRLGIKQDQKVLLCFGRIKPYKGIEHLFAAFKQLVAYDESYRLIVAGEVQKGNEAYWNTLKESVTHELALKQIIPETQFIPDEAMELYLKASDALVLPYNEIFQSGVLFLGYSFGLPVIATDVGSFREEIVEGVTGYICKPSDPMSLAGAIRTYFAGDLYRDLDVHRQRIRDYAEINHSWSAVAELTRTVYAKLLRSNAS